MKKILIATLFLFILNMGSTIKAASSLKYTVNTTNVDKELYDGVNWKHLTATSTNDSGTSTNQNVHVVTANKDNVKLVNWSAFNNSGKLVAKTPLELAQDFEAKNPGYTVLAGVNGDYFTTGVTINANVIFGGDILKHDNHQKYTSVYFSEDGNENYNEKSNKLTNDHYLTIYNEDNSISGIYKLAGFNKTSLLENQTTVFYNTSAHKPFVKATNFLVDGLDRYTKNGNNFYFNSTVTSQIDTFTSVSDQQLVISTLNEEIIETLKEGNKKIRVQKMFADQKLFYNNMIGVGSRILEEGNVRTFEEIVDQNLDFSKARAPRTSFGFTEEGNVVLATVDGRQGNFSKGVDLRELGEVMKSYDCKTAYNLDGGGSTLMVVRENNELKIVNSYSDPNPRAVYNALLIVVPDVCASFNISNVKKDSADFTYSISNNNNLEILESFVVYNGNYKKLDEMSGTINLTGLNAGDFNSFDIVVKYKKDNNVYQHSFNNKVISLDKKYGLYEPQLPTDLKVDFVQDDDNKGVIVKVSFNDPDDTITKVDLVDNNEKLIPTTKNENNEWVASISDLETNTILEYTVLYSNSIDNTTRASDTTYKYTYIEKPIVIVTTTENKTTISENNNGSSCKKSNIGYIDIIGSILSLVLLTGTCTAIIKRK